ncbi:cytochrome P450 [Cerasibacillus terrae]|uniref:Cytochrome P450 n=1 Tax=Cerasibacillus terrae TaxID=2498845 RepID=A0A5C8NRC0_9BACI|nr:cytochrome P450 [Cerasibacillus terrae]TXL63657.1 cytochrome P450 [Cerasibacillus terrae]
MGYREQIPIDHGFDHSVALLLEGYQFISNRRHRFQSDIFETRLLGGKKAICIAGADAAMVFYDEEKCTRHQVAPKRIRQTIFGEKSVQTLDKQPHEHRKQLFMDVMNPKQMQQLEKIVEKQWKVFLKQWEQKKTIILFEEVQKLLTISACRWVGVPLKAKELTLRTNQLVSLFDSAAAIGIRHWQGRRARNQLNLWIEQMVEQVRKGKIQPNEESPLYRFVWHRDEQGKLLPPRVVAVEIINLLRPIVAISVYIAFSALAIHEYPDEKGKLMEKNDQYLHMFVQEVRRFYPFFPFVVAKVREDFLWKGHDFRKGNLVLLDLYGTNHHPSLWKKPNEFNPERFKNWEGGLFDLIPQGGGNFVKNHRCPGEWLTILVMKISMDMLVNYMEYDVLKQNLKYSMIRMPTFPKSGFALSNVRSK